jgi:hypothetical protein
MVSRSGQRNAHSSELRKPVLNAKRNRFSHSLVSAALVNSADFRWRERINFVIVTIRAAVDHVVPTRADKGYRVYSQQAICHRFIYGAAQKRGYS